VGRAAAVLALVAALVAWYEIAPHVDGWSLWPSFLLIAFVLMPATFLIAWLALPLAERPWWHLGVGAVVLLLAAFVFWKVDLPIPSSFCKFLAFTLFGFAFLQAFQELSWVVLVAALIPLVDAYSVWRGPTNDITEHHEEVFGAVAVSFVVPGGGVAQLGPPDVAFFAVFLAASVRFGLRPFWTWLGMSLGLALTMICVAWWDVSGLPALPGISLGFLAANADLLWRRWRPAQPRPAA
jgi:hypothetical protein